MKLPVLTYGESLLTLRRGAEIPNEAKIPALHPTDLRHGDFREVGLKRLPDDVFHITSPVGAGEIYHA